MTGWKYTELDSSTHDNRYDSWKYTKLHSNTYDNRYDRLEIHKTTLQYP